MSGRQDTPRLAVPVGSRDHVPGLATAPVTFVEYGDYECPSCGAAYPIVKEVQWRLSARLRFVFRNFPLTTVHPHAQYAAEAAEAAGAQRRFWEMGGTLFEHHHALTDEALIGYVKALGLDTIRFTHDLRQHRYAAHRREDVASGVRSGVNGTPTLYINLKTARFALAHVQRTVRNTDKAHSGHCPRTSPKVRFWDNTVKPFPTMRFAAIQRDEQIFTHLSG